MSDNNHWIHIAKIVAVFGVKGAVKLYSYTDPRQNITEYSTLYVKRAALKKIPQASALLDVSTQKEDYQALHFSNIRAQGKHIVGSIKSVADRNLAEALVGLNCFIHADDLPDIGSDNYYWRDLLGLQVINTKDELLGTVESLDDNGVQTILVVKRPDARYLIPFVEPDIVTNVDLEASTISVEWDLEDEL